jgi:hypothetical protein
LLRERGKISDVQKRQRAARAIAAYLVQLSAVGFIVKAASSVGSETLIEDVQAVAKKRNTTAFRLIELSASLDTLKRIPRDKIESLIDETKDELVPNRVLQFLILRHLYMFRTTEMEKQWLASKGAVGLRIQKGIEMKTAKIKKLRK